MHRALVDEPAMFAINDRGLAERRFFQNDLKQSEGDQTDVTATRWALERNLLPHPGHQFRPGNPRGVVRAGLSRQSRSFDGSDRTPGSWEFPEEPLIESRPRHPIDARDG